MQITQTRIALNSSRSKLLLGPKSLGIVGLVVCAMLTTHASGVSIDLTTVGTDGALNGSLFYQYTSGGSGSGAVDEFIRYQAASTDSTQGYNTDGSPFQFNELSGGFTHSILLSAFPRIQIGSIIYREFAFDLNESGSTSASFLSLDTVEVYVAGSGSLLGHPGFGGSATLIYDMDQTIDNEVLLTMSASGGGSGKLDMLMYVPESLFTGVGTYGSDPNVILYSKVGGKGDEGGSNPDWTNSDGFEGWSVSSDEEEGRIVGGPGFLVQEGNAAVPEPSAFIIAAMGLLSFGFCRWTRRRA